MVGTQEHCCAFKLVVLVSQIINSYKLLFSLFSGSSWHLFSKKGHGKPRFHHIPNT